jgi:hypothetical protein
MVGIMELASRKVSARFGGHAYVVAALVLVSLGLSFLLWFHASAGYASGGILDGADLRLDAIQILWWQALVFVTSSTVAIALLPIGTRARYAIAYGAGIATCLLAMPLLDRVF